MKHYHYLITWHDTEIAVIEHDHPYDLESQHDHDIDGFSHAYPGKYDGPLPTWQTDDPSWAVT
jgi:hypothetical protein